MEIVQFNNGLRRIYKKLNIAVAQKLASCSFSVEEQLHCLHERFFVIEPYAKEK